MNNGGESCYWTEVAWIELTIWKWNRQINVLLQSAHYGTNDFSKAVSPLFVFTRRLWHHSAHYIRTRESRLPAIAVEYRRFVGTNCQSDKLQTGKNSTFILFSTFEERILIWDWSAWSVFFRTRRSSCSTAFKALHAKVRWSQKEEWTGWYDLEECRLPNGQNKIATIWPRLALSIIYICFCM